MSKLRHPIISPVRLSGNALLLAAFALVVFFAGPPTARALSTPMLELRAAASVTCPSTGTTPIEIAPANARSICVSNTSTTCVRLGNKDGGTGEPTTSLGMQVGSGCAAGMVYCADVQNMGCMAESATVLVGVVYGAP